MPALFLAAAFLNSFLMFWVQPLLAKALLPLFGGAPAVWTVCVLFFQASLLAGYALAHATARAPGFQAAWLALGALALPFGLSAAAPQGEPTWALLRALAASAGAPFLALAANSSLIQASFSRAKLPGSKDPYFLYAASNAGSLLGLLAFPLLLEPSLNLRGQTQAWTAGYAALTLLTGVCAWAARSWDAASAGPARQARPLPWTTRLRWAVLAAVPSAMTLALTAYLSSSVPPIPLLWVLPLALYLGTYVLAFARRPLVSKDLARKAVPILIVPVSLLVMTEALRPLWLVVPLHLAGLAAVGLACHGELARSRPPAGRLTEFYLWIALGGACGGLLNAAAPYLLKDLWEYPAALIAACLLLPATHRTRPEWPDLGWPLALGAASVAVPLAARTFNIVPAELSLKPLLALSAVACFLLKERPRRLAAGLAALFAASLVYRVEAGRASLAQRSFFGVHRVVLDPAGTLRWLTHGGVAHGGQSLDPSRAREPLAYYHPTGPLGEVVALAPKGPAAGVGLGTGSSACLRQSGARWTFYEIDPAVETIARENFTFLRDCAPRSLIVRGDARLSLARAEEERFGLIILDAFSGDVVPLHLLTREALALYLARLAPRGVLAFHATNDYLDLSSALGDLAADAGLAAWRRRDEATEEDRRLGKFSSTWVAMAREAKTLERLGRGGRWARLEGAAGRAWTDARSSVLPLVRWR